MKKIDARASSDLIDQNLRRAFKQVEDQELPDRFKDLLSRLQSGESVSSTVSEAGE